MTGKGSLAARFDDLVRRFTARCGAILFARNTVASFLAFGLDVGLLWLFVDRMGWHRMVAAAIAFLIAISIHYVISRIWVFRSSERAMGLGFVYFLVNSGVGLAITMSAFAALIYWTPIHYLVARLISSVVAGLAVFVLNAKYNFRQL